MSYDYVPKKEFTPYLIFCSSKTNQLKQALKKKGIACTFYCIGSYARNKVTRNGNAPFDLDYNLEIEGEIPKKSSDLQKLKDLVRSAMDSLIAKDKNYHLNYSCGKDSTSAITYILHKKDSNIVDFSFDIGIVSRKKKGNLQRLIHDKHNNRFLWNEVADSKETAKRAKELKLAGHTDEIKSEYLMKKNFYLQEGTTEAHPSFNIYIETINELYYKHLCKQGAKQPKHASKKSSLQAYLPKVNQTNASMYINVFKQKGWIPDFEFSWENTYENGIAYWSCSEKKSRLKSEKMRNKRASKRSVAYKIIQSLK